MAITGVITPVSMHSADISTAEKKSEALDILWAKWLTIDARNTAVNDLIGQLEAQAKTNLEGRET